MAVEKSMENPAMRDELCSYGVLSLFPDAPPGRVHFPTPAEFGCDVLCDTSIRLYLSACRDMRELNTAISFLRLSDVPSYRCDRYFQTWKHMFDKRLTTNALFVHTHKHERALQVQHRQEIASRVVEPGKHRKISVPKFASWHYPQTPRVYGKDSNFWIVPIVPGDDVELPTVSSWTPRLGRQWVLSQARKCFVKGQPKNWASVGNGSAFLLFKQQVRPHPAVLANILATASVFWCDMNRESKQFRSRPLLSDWVDPTGRLSRRYLLVGGARFYDVDALALMSETFKRDKPIFKKACEYLSGAPVDRSVLQGAIDAVVARRDVKISRQKQSGEDVLAETLFGLNQVCGSVIQPRELLETALSFIVRDLGMVDFGLQLSRVIALCVSLCDCSSVKAMVAALYNFVTGIPLIHQSLLDGLKHLSNVAELQGEISFAELSTGSFANTQLGRAFWNVFSGVSVLQLATFIPGYQESYFPAVMSFLKTVSRWEHNESVLLLQLVSFLRVVCEKIFLCIKMQSFQPMWDEAYDPEQWIRVCDAITMFSQDVVTQAIPTPQFDSRLKELRSKKLIPDHWLTGFSPQEFKELVDATYLQGEKVIKAFSSNIILSSELRKRQSSLRAFLEAYSVTVNVMSPRPQPFGVWHCGPAGSGKTTLTSLLIKSVGRSRDWPIDSRAVHDWQIGVNFQDGLGPTQWVVKVDDADNDPAPAARGQSNHAMIIMQVIDNKPLPVEQSSVELKGKVCARPLLCVYNSNFRDLRLKGFSLYPPAIWRRLPYRVEVRAKEIYSKGNDMLDPEKIKLCPDGELYDIEISEFDPSRYDPADPFGLPYVSLGKFSRSEYLKFMIQKFNAHLEVQRACMLSLNFGDRFCPTCFADVNEDVGCSCKTVASETQMRWIYPAMGVLGLVGLFGARKARQFWSMIDLRLANAKSSFYTTLDTQRQYLAADLQAQYQMIKRETVEFLRIGRNVALTTVGVSMGVVMLRYLYNRLLAERSSVCLQARENNGTEATLVDFHRAEQTFQPGLPPVKSTFTLEDICDAISRSELRVARRDVRLAMYGVQVGHEAFMIPKHLLGDLVGDFSVELEIVQRGVTLTMKATPLNTTFSPSKDVAFVRCSSLCGSPPISKKFWFDIDQSVGQFDGYLISDFSKIPKLGSGVAQMVVSNGVPHVSVPGQTQPGDCGRLYVAKMNSGWKIVAMHVQLVSITNVKGTAEYSLGLCVTEREIENALHRVTTTTQGVILPLRQTGLTPDAQEFTHYPPKSEVWTAVSQRGVQVFPLGTAKHSVHGCSMKTACRPTLFAEDFRDLEKEWCGRENYWVAPTFAGKMFENKWLSPFTRSFTSLKRCQPDEDVLCLAFLDYVKVFHQLDTEGYRQLSDAEIVRGIPGTVINPMEMKTSVGMPFNRVKRSFFRVVDDEVYIDDRVWDLFEDFRNVLRGGNIPVPVTVCTLKDEPVKFSKVEDCDTRVFNCLPAAWNMTMKQIFAPVKAFMRANPFACECMVGINMMSIDAKKVHDHLLEMDPSGLRIVEIDYTKQDKSMNGYQLLVCSWTAFYLLYLLGGDMHAGYSLVMGSKNVVMILKNDFFQMAAQNVSGQDITVELNSWSNSMSNRYAYFRRVFPDGLPLGLKQQIRECMRQFLRDPSCVRVFWDNCEVLHFRVRHSLCTYGDDLLKAVSSLEHYDGDQEQQFFRELGYEITDGQKRPVVSLQSIHDVLFLKRNFRFDVDLDCLVTPLLKKTLIKMLVLRGGSTLSERDHNATLLTDVLRESVYHGKKFFEMMKERIAIVAEKYELQTNSYYRPFLFEAARELIQRGAFKTWTAVPNVLG